MLSSTPADLMVTHLNRLMLLATCAAVPASLAAQSWPEIGFQAGVGVSVVDAKGMASGMLVVTRAWGPVVGGVGGELRLAARGNSGNQPRYDPLNGRFYCDHQPVNSASQNCFTALAGEASLTGEIGFTLAPFAPIVLTAGYRSGAPSEPFAAVTMFGPTRRDRVSWMGRVAAGRKLILLIAGIVLELGSPF